MSLATYASSIITSHFMETKEIKHLTQLTIQDSRFDSEPDNLDTSIAMSVKASFTPLKGTQKFQVKPP